MMLSDQEHFIVPLERRGLDLGISMPNFTDGAFWSPRMGAKCPVCQTWNRKWNAKNTTMPWDGNTRIRYVTCVCGHRFKAIEVDEVFDG